MGLALKCLGVRKSNHRRIESNCECSRSRTVHTQILFSNLQVNDNVISLFPDPWRPMVAGRMWTIHNQPSVQSLPISCPRPVAFPKGRRYSECARWSTTTSTAGSIRSKPAQNFAWSLRRWFSVPSIWWVPVPTPGCNTDEGWHERRGILARFRWRRRPMRPRGRESPTFRSAGRRPHGWWREYRGVVWAIGGIGLCCCSSQWCR